MGMSVLPMVTATSRDSANAASSRTRAASHTGVLRSKPSASQLGGDMVAQLGGVLVEPEADSIGKEDLLGLDPDVMVYSFSKVREWPPRRVLVLIYVLVPLEIHSG